MKRVLDGRWQKLTRHEQNGIAEEFRTEIGYLYTDRVRQLIAADQRIALDLLKAGNLDDLNAYAAYRASAPSLQIIWSDGLFRRRLPPEIAKFVHEDDRVVAAPKALCRLEDVKVNGVCVSVTVSVRIPDLDGAPDSLIIRARKRNTAIFDDFQTTYEDLTRDTRSFLITAAHDSLGRGIWDLFVVVRFGEFEKEVRFGSDRARTVEPEGVSNLHEDPEPGKRVITYFTKGPGNLSVDRGAVLHRRIGKARAIGLTVDENGRALMLVQTSSEPLTQDEYFGYLEGVPQHGGRQLLPSIRLGERLIGLRLPVSSHMVGANLAVTAVLEGARAPLRANGTEFWPARAAGFGLALEEDGSLTVTTPNESGRNYRPLPTFDARVPGLRLHVARDRAKSAIKNTPVIGSALTRTVRFAKGRLS